MRTVALYQMIFGLITLVGGIIGFVAGSSVSLIAGGIAGFILIFTGLRLQKGWRPGLYVALIVALVLAGNFGRSYFVGEGKFMPGGLMIILSAISVLLVILVLVQPKERKREF